MAKLFFYDLETTGVKHWQNGIHQFSGRIVIDGETKEEFNFKVKPHPAAKIEEVALEIGGVNLEIIEGYDDMNLTFRKFTTMLANYVNRFEKKDKFHLVGYNNASFDNNFLRTWFKGNLDDYFGSWFWSDSIDVMVLASRHLMNERHTMPNFKLMTVAKHLGIKVEEEKLHDALYDIHLTQEIYNILNR